MNFPINALNPAEKRLLHKMQLTSLYDLNANVFNAQVVSLYAKFSASKAAKTLSGSKTFEAFVQTLGWAKRDAFTQRSLTDVPKRLSYAIWKHLENRGFVKGWPQDSIDDERINRIYKAFACFIIIRCFAGGVMAVTNKQDGESTKILEDVESKQHPLTPVGTIPNPGKHGA